MGNYFYDDKGNIKETLLTTEAKLWAESFIKPARSKDRYQNNPPLNMTQLRKFHIEVKTLDNRLKALGNAEKRFLEQKPIVKMLKAKVAYACPTKGKRKVPEEFRKYIEEMVDKIDNWKDFQAFSLCFESVVGYFVGEGGRIK